MGREIRILPYHHLRGDSDELLRPTTQRACLEEFFGREFLVVPSGRYAISAIIKSLELKPDDEVYITTTSESSYVTSCITCTIFNNCRPSRVLTEKTKVIFIVHEFGVPNPRTEWLADYARMNNIKVIEDCAHTFDSMLREKRVGTMAEYAIYSLTKIFPLSEGGVITGPSIHDITPQNYDHAKMSLLEGELARYMPLLSVFSRKRIENFMYLKQGFMDVLMDSTYDLADGITPYFFPLHTFQHDPGPIVNKLVDDGVECGVWWGRNAVLIPNHPLLNQSDLDYILSSAKKAVPRI